MRAQRTNEARNLFMKYGFMPSISFNFQGTHKNYRVFDEVNNKFVSYKFQNFLNDIKTGKVQEVDPFLHSLNVHTNRIQGPNQPVFVDRLTRYTRYFPIDIFRTESANVRNLTMQKATNFKRMANPRNPQDIEVRRAYDTDQDKSSIYAIIDAIYVISTFDYDKDINIVINVDFRMDNNIHDYHFPDIYYINEETVIMLENLIKNLFYGEDIAELDASDKYKLLSIKEWEKITIFFDKDERQKVFNRLNNPNIKKILNQPARRRRGGAKWLWINTTPIDLSKFGIFNSFDKNNYRFPCFIYALEQSGVLTSSEIEYVKSIINTRTFPIDHVKLICEKLDISIHIHYYSNKQGKIYNSGEYGSNPNRLIQLLLRSKHYMLYENVDICAGYIKNYDFIDKNIREKDYEKRYMARKVNNYGVPTYATKPLNINQIIDIFFECNYFKPLNNMQLSETMIQKRDIKFEDLSYPECSAKPVEHKQKELSEKNVVYTNNIERIVAINRAAKINKYKGTIRTVETNDTVYKNNNIWFSFEPTNQEISAFRDVMLNKFGINIDEFDSAAAVGQELMHKYKCYDNVYELGGKPAIFISKCAPKIAVQPAFHEKQDVKGDLVSLDKNGSYTSIYRDFDGIPCGKPKILTNELWEKRDEFNTYYVYIDIVSMKCKHTEERFSTISNLGPNFLHKTIFENLLKHYDLEYKFISGYYFDEGFNNNIKKLAMELYDLREYFKSLNHRIEAAFKGILCTLWGKCVYKQKKTQEKHIEIERSDDFLNVNYDFIYKSRQINNNIISFTLTKPLSLEYGIPQFSTNILSFSRSFMNDLYFKATDLQIPIYYSNTDCLLLDHENIDKLGIIGDKLGEFKIEYKDISRAIIISGKKFLWIYKSGEIRCICRHKKETNEENIALFEQLYNKD